MPSPQLAAVRAYADEWSQQLFADLRSVGVVRDVLENDRSGSVVRILQGMLALAFQQSFLLATVLTHREPRWGERRWVRELEEDERSSRLQIPGYGPVPLSRAQTERPRLNVPQAIGRLLELEARAPACDCPSTDAATENVQRDGETGTDDTVERALAAFLDAFMCLDHDRLRTYFAEDATIFHPWGGSRQPQFWNATMDEWRTNRPGPPELDIQPHDVHIQSLGDVAVVTFHFRRDAAALGRRTFVWHKTPSGWKIVHLHASNLPAAEAPSLTPTNHNQ
jgi:ketosteroid isomerase-like protein